MPQNGHRTGFRGPSPDVGLATQFKPGQPSANPGGRPRTAPLAQACRELLVQPFPGDAEGRTYAQVIAAKLAEKALAGDIAAAKELADRAEGRARPSDEESGATTNQILIVPSWKSGPHVSSSE
jgi:hypothetical protein